MSRNFMNTRSWFLVVLLIIGITTCIVPASAVESAWLEIQSNPSGSWACIDHWNCQNTPVTFSIDPNSYHTLTVYKDGYQMSTQTILSAGPGVTTPITVSLFSNPLHFGSADIRSTPNGAGIWIDRVYYGKTPMVISDLSAGDHTLTLRKAGYYDFNQGLIITAGQTMAFNPNLVSYPANPGYGSLQIDSVPGGAAIYLNNNYQGATKAQGESFDINQLTPGSYTVKLTLPNYQNYLTTLDIREGMIYDIHAVMVPGTPTTALVTTGGMTVRSSPSGANIYIDNAYRGLTPLTINDIMPGSHAIILKMNGYLDWQSSVNVQAGGITEVSGTLSPGTYPTALAPLEPTQSPIGLVSIVFAIGICFAAVVLSGKCRKNN